MADVEDYKPRHARAEEDKPTNWIPNRKVASAAISGLVGLGLYWKFGPDMDPELVGGLTLAVMTIVGYFVPLPED